MLLGQRLWVILAGISAGCLFVLAAGGMVSGMLMAYTPFMPLLLIGLMLGGPSTLLASGIASGISGLALGPMGLVIFLLLVAVPCSYYIHRSLTHIQVTGGFPGWYPQGLALTHLTYYAAALVVLMTLTLHTTTNGAGLGALLPPVTDGEAEWLAAARSWMTEQAFLILGGTAWVQISLFYGIAVLANFLLTGYGRAIRPSLALFPFMPSGLLLTGLLGAGVLSFSDDIATSLAAKSAFITLLYPYFLMGISLMHRFSLLWPSRKFWLALVYLFMLMFPFFLLVFISLGLAAQARYLSNRSSGQAS